MSTFIRNSIGEIEKSNIRANGNATVHLGQRYVGNNNFRPLCGSGETTTYSRKRSNYVKTNDPVTCKKCLKRLTDQAKIKAFLEMVDQKPAATEPQTAAYQAAVDNVYDEMRRAAISIQNSWNFESGTTRYDRWDYEMELERAIDAGVFHASHSYRLYS